MDETLEERIARLEATVKLLLELRKDEIDTLKELKTTVDSMTSKFDKYETRWGWVTMFATAVGGAILILKDWIIDSFSRGS